MLLVFGADAPGWLLTPPSAARVVGGLYTLLVPPLLYRIHRWEITSEAVYTLSGWLVREWRIAPISRVQTVDTERGPLQQLLKLADLTVTTASARGPVKISGLDEQTATELARTPDRDHPGHAPATPHELPDAEAHRRSAPCETPWRRLDPRMLVIGPVNGLVRLLPIAVILLVTGQGDVTRLWIAAGDRRARGAGQRADLADHPLPDHRGAGGAAQRLAEPAAPLGPAGPDPHRRPHGQAAAPRVRAERRAGERRGRGVVGALRAEPGRGVQGRGGAAAPRAAGPLRRSRPPTRPRPRRRRRCRSWPGCTGRGCGWPR